MTTRSILSFVTALALFGGACDAATREEVSGLQQRIDTLVSENATTREKAAALTESVAKAEAAAAAANARVDELTVSLDQAKAELAKLSASVTALETKAVKPALPAGRPDPAVRYRVDVGTSAAEGPADAKVTIVIFSDFQCPFCARVQATLDQVQKDYGSDVRVVAKHNPLAFHTNAEGAARAAEAAGKQGKFWEMHDKLYANIKALSTTDLEAYAKDLGLDVARFRKDMASSDVLDRISDDKAQAKELGATGTPSFFVNGKFLSGAQPLESFKTLIDAEIANADAVIAGGVSRSRLYDELMATAKPGVGLGK